MKLIGALLARQPRRYALPGAQMGLDAPKEPLSSPWYRPRSARIVVRWLDTVHQSRHGPDGSRSDQWLLIIFISWNMVERGGFGLR